jgi:predicted phosphodiesterase
MEKTENTGITKICGTKFAVFSDIHSNFEALRACYADALALGVDAFIFLGDYVSDLGEPVRTMELVYEIISRYPCICLRGNRERYMLEHDSGQAHFTKGSSSGSLLFTYENLTRLDLDFFKSLKISDTITINGILVEIAHSAMDNDRYYFDDKDGRAGEIFEQMKCNYFLTAHTHKQYIIEENGKTIINPGSLGIPQGGDRQAKYALLETKNSEICATLRSVNYDIAKVIHSQFASGLVDYANYWATGVLYDIITGQECIYKLLLQVEKAGSVNDEEVWRATAQRFGMKFTEKEILDFYRECR